ncbi:MAG: DUF2330 domain-containing protein [Gemmataceae bacterium]|nr:DUF2330 domain-containing protein [Gemmataceae bacterium]
MTVRSWLALLLAGVLLVTVVALPAAFACCPAGPSGKPVVNADQTVIIIWDAVNKVQHFIRKASFKSEADDFGFLIPTPAEPELAESGNDAFPYLFKLTEPETITRPRPSGVSCGCSKSEMKKEAQPGKKDLAVRVLAEKEVAGFQAVVLETKSADALVGWLKQNGYAFSPEVKEWAKPYVEGGWKVTALKVAKDKEGKAKDTVAAGALRLTFKTDRPLFPYREPDSKSAAQALGARSRLLRIYFLAEARYQGDLTREVPWTGKVAWANPLTPADRKKVLELLQLPENTGPASWWLTEFEDDWPYRVAPADVYFARSGEQGQIKRDPIIIYVAAPWPTDVMVYAFAAALLLPPLLRRARR